jgi:hypothetical protein
MISQNKFLLATGLVAAGGRVSCVHGRRSRGVHRTMRRGRAGSAIPVAAGTLALLGGVAIVGAISWPREHKARSSFAPFLCLRETITPNSVATARGRPVIEVGQFPMAM